jgi:hypothetical protein
MLAILVESTETRCILSWMRASLGRIGGGSFCFQAPGHRLLIRAHLDFDTDQCATSRFNHKVNLVLIFIQVTGAPLSAVATSSAKSEVKGA